MIEQEVTITDKEIVDESTNNKIVNEVPISVIKTNNFSASKKKPEELKRLFFIDENEKQIVYPVDSFESDTGWVESVMGKEDSDFRRVIVFKESTSVELIEKTIEFIRHECNPGTYKEHAGWMCYGDEDNPMIRNLKTSST